MTSLELTLGSILGSIEKAKDAGNSQVLGALLQRKDTISAALAAPEHCWHVLPTDNARRQCEREESLLMPLLANSGV